MEDASTYFDQNAVQTPADPVAHIGPVKGSKKNNNKYKNQNANGPADLKPAAPLNVPPVVATPVAEVSPQAVPQLADATPHVGTEKQSPVEPLLKGISDMFDDIPELINAAAAVSNDVQKVLPLGEIPTAVIVAALAGVGAYMALKKVEP